MNRRHLRLIAMTAIAALLLVPCAVGAQEKGSAVVLDLVRKVLIDPTTYAPAVIAFAATSEDWKTSQVLFQNGWVEANPRFTVSGRPNDVPVTYAAGQRLIRKDMLVLLQYSVVNNAAAGIGERLLIGRYPSHKKLIRTLSWIERIGFASILTYHSAADHLRQARTNRRLASEYGYNAP